MKAGSADPRGLFPEIETRMRAFRARERLQIAYIEARGRFPWRLLPAGLRRRLFLRLRGGGHARD